MKSIKSIFHYLFVVFDFIASSSNSVFSILLYYILDDNLLT